MAEVETYVETSDKMDDIELQTAENIDLENVQTIEDSEVPFSDDQIPEEKKQVQNKSEIIRSARLPTTRIKNIMKTDPDVSVLSSDSVFLVAKATELFLETLAKETYAYTATNKRKIISKKDLDMVINKVDCLCFLEGAMDF